jgi:hypothetical protein
MYLEGAWARQDFKERLRALSPVFLSSSLFALDY